MAPDRLSQPVRYVGAQVARTDSHHGGLRPAIGVQSVQVVRANRLHPEWAEGLGWTYNHGPMLAYWQGRFYLEYLSNPLGEHVPPGHTLLTSSNDGIHWEKPVVVFPVYAIPDGFYQAPPGYRLPPGSDAVMHQRMGFYVAPNGRLLVLGFYGICPQPQVFPNDGRGIGRVVREVHSDRSFGPITFIRINRHTGWHEGNTRYPLYGESNDAGFVAACEALLSDRLATLQWWEEDRSPDDFYAVTGYKALSYFHRADGQVVGLWKWSKAAISADEGRTWSQMTDVPSLVMAGGKAWGQRTSDGRYAIVYNPTPDGQHRWPLGVVTSDDGAEFDDLLVVHGEVPPRRFTGTYKDFGPQYVRGISEGNGIPPDGAMWLTYSVNKEDIWVSRVPVPIRYREERPVHDTFDEMETDGVVTGWNVYSPYWAPVSVVNRPDGGKCLELCDRDPSDYAKAERAFPESQEVTLVIRLLAQQIDHGELHIEVVDQVGAAAVRLSLDLGGQIMARSGGSTRRVGVYAPDTWLEFRVHVDVNSNRYELAIDGARADRDTGGPYLFAAPVGSVERLVLRTGPRRYQPTVDTDRESMGDVVGVDDPVKLAVFWIDEVSTTGHRGA